MGVGGGAAPLFRVNQSIKTGARSARDRSSAKTIYYPITSLLIAAPLSVNLNISINDKLSFHYYLYLIFWYKKSKAENAGKLWKQPAVRRGRLEDLRTQEYSRIKHGWETTKRLITNDR